MSASDEFKSEIRNNELDTDSIGKALKTALTEAIELKITTWVVPAGEGNALASGEPKPGYRMRTRINIVDGDIDNEVGSPFVASGPYSELREFHLSQVQESRAILQQNLQSLQQLFGMLFGAAQAIAEARQGGTSVKAGLLAQTSPPPAARSTTPQDFSSSDYSASLDYSSPDFPTQDFPLEDGAFSSPTDGSFRVPPSDMPFR